MIFVKVSTRTTKNIRKLGERTFWLSVTDFLFFYLTNTHVNYFLSAKLQLMAAPSLTNFRKHFCTNIKKFYPFGIEIPHLSMKSLWLLFSLINVWLWRARYLHPSLHFANSVEHNLNVKCVPLTIQTNQDHWDQRRVRDIKLCSKGKTITISMRCDNYQKVLQNVRYLVVQLFAYYQVLSIEELKWRLLFVTFYPLSTGCHITRLPTIEITSTWQELVQCYRNWLGQEN